MLGGSSLKGRKESRSATCAPLSEVFALRGELDDPGVAVAVRHEDVASLGVDSHVGGFAEVTTVTSWYEGLSQCHQYSVSAVTANFEHLRSNHRTLQHPVRLESQLCSLQMSVEAEAVEDNQQPE